MKRLTSHLAKPKLTKPREFATNQIGPRATTRPTAVALAYEMHSVAPRVLAKGEGVIAEAILAKAKDVGIPLKVEPELVTMLMQLDVDSYVPPALYAAIAEILVWAYQIDAASNRKPSPITGDTSLPSTTSDLS